MKKEGLVNSLIQVLILSIILGFVKSPTQSLAETSNISPFKSANLDKVEFIFTLNKKSFAGGEDVKLELLILNRGNEKVSLDLPDSGPPVRFLILDGSRREIWNSSHDMFFLMVITPFAIEPGELKRYSVSWSQKDTQGANVMVGHHIARASTRFYNGKVDLEIEFDLHY